MNIPKNTLNFIERFDLAIKDGMFEYANRLAFEECAENQKLIDALTFFIKDCGYNIKKFKNIYKENFYE